MPLEIIIIARATITARQYLLQRRYLVQRQGSETKPEQEVEDDAIAFLPEVLDEQGLGALLDEEWTAWTSKTSLVSVLAWCLLHTHDDKATFDPAVSHLSDPDQDAARHFVDSIMARVELAMLGAFLHSATMYGDDIVASVSFFDNRQQLPVFWNALGRILEAEARL